MVIDGNRSEWLSCGGGGGGGGGDGYLSRWTEKQLWPLECKGVEAEM